MLADVRDGARTERDPRPGRKDELQNEKEWHPTTLGEDRALYQKIGNNAYTNITAYKYNTAYKSGSYPIPQYQ